MAEVTGDLGGQPIQLNNAATEATLRQLLAAMTVIANNTGKDKAAQVKSQKELERELNKLAAASKKQAAEQDKLTKETEKAAEATEKAAEATKKAAEATKKDTEAKKKQLDADARAIKAQKEYIDQLNGLKGAMSGLGSSVAGVATGMTGMLSSLANLGNSLTATAAVFGSIPVVGGVLSSMFGAVAGAAEKTYEAFKKSASVGANFGGSMTEMIDSATGAGLTFDEFSGIIAKTGKDLALLGGDSEAGARRLGALGKQIKGTTLAADLNRLGYSTEAINEGMASYAGQLAKTGSLQGMSDAQLVAGTGAYLKDLDSLTKLTGKNKSELEGERNARLKDSQFRLIMSKMDVESQKNLQNLMDSIPAEHQEGMKEIIATGTATSEAGKKALAFLPDSAKNMMSLNQQIRTTGKMGANQAAELNAAYQRETQAFVKSGAAENMALYGDEASKRFFVGAADAAAKEKNLAQIQAEQQKAAEERKKKEGELKDKGLDPAAMEAYKNKIAETSNEFTKFLANSGMLDIMMEAFATLVDIVQLIVVPAFQFVADNFGTIAMVVGGAYAAFLALKGVILAANIKLALQTLAATANAAAMGANTVATTATSFSMARLSLSMIPLIIPFIKIALVVGALIGTFLLVKKVFSEVYKAGWDLGTVFEAIGDSFKSVLLTIADGFLWLIEKLTPNSSDANKKIKEAQKGVEVERQALKEKEKARDAQREANKSARAAADAKEELETVSGRKAARAKEKEAEASDAVSKAKEKETEAAKASTTSVPGVNLSSPQAMFDSMVKQQQGTTAGATNQPGAANTTDGSYDRAEAARLKRQSQPPVGPPTPPGATATAPVTGAATPPPPPPPKPADPSPINQDQQKNMEMIKNALIKQGMTDPKMIAATLGNVMKESGGKSQTENLKYGKTSNDRIRSIFGERAKGKTDKELDSIKGDEKQMGEMMYGSTTKIGKSMGNMEPGDGFKYRGRGFIQITGKNNYASASKAIYGDDRLVENPDLANDPAVAAEISAHFMKKNTQGMAKRMGMTDGPKTQEDANKLATSVIAGTDVTKAKGYLGGEVLNKVNAYAGNSQIAALAGSGLSAQGNPSVPAQPKPPVTATAQTTPAQPKPPVTATAQTTPAQPKPLSGVDENIALYGAQEEKDRLFAQVMASMPSNLPTTAAVQTAVTPTPAAGATTQQAEAERAEAERAKAAATDPRRTDRPQTAVAGARQETPESLLASLNTKMDQLIAINRSLKDTNERQLSVQKGIAQGGDLYAAA